MLKRLSSVDSIHINTVTSASQFQIGDAKEIELTTYALAMVRDAEIWTGNEGNFNKFQIYKRPAKLPLLYEPLIVKTNNHYGKIEVGKINILGVASSSLIQIGSNDFMTLDTRLKHIRHLTIPPNDNLNKAAN